MADEEPKKSGGRADRSGLRHINGLLRDIELIEAECLGEQTGNKHKGLDEFQAAKADLADTLKMLKKEIKTKKNMEDSVGTTSETIKLKHSITANLERARQLQASMEIAYEQDQRDYDNGLSEIKSDDIRARQELCALMKQDYEFTENEFNPKSGANGGGGFRLARDARAKRKKKRDQGLISSEPQPLTAKQQEFIQESIQRDEVLDEKLDIIKQGVMQLNAIGHDINLELDKQSVMLKEVGEKMDAVTEKLENRNQQIKDLLEASGGAQRWCPVLILLVVLLACCGYIYSTFVA